MKKDIESDYRRLREEFLALEKSSSLEREQFISLVKTLCRIIGMSDPFREQTERLCSQLNVNPIPWDEIHKQRDAIKNQAYNLTLDQDKRLCDEIEHLDSIIKSSCQIIKNLIFHLINGLYPGAEKIVPPAETISLKCHKRLNHKDLISIQEAVLNFIGELRNKIKDDFNGINSSFATLLQGIKELEDFMIKEFNLEGRIKEMNDFQGSILKEMNTMIESFDVHENIEEIKKALVTRIINIKDLMAKKKEQELSLLKKTKQRIDTLKKRIKEAEKSKTEMKKRAEQFEKEALMDPLTGVYNRRAFDIRLAQLMEKFRMGEAKFSLILLDIDKFKYINDTLGHQAGDRILKKMAQCLKETFRKNDLIARYGGDEFVVLVEDMEKDMAKQRLVIFMKNFKKRRFISHKAGPVDVTVSAGIATPKKGEGVEELIERADKAMYRIKNARHGTQGEK